MILPPPVALYFFLQVSQKLLQTPLHEPARKANFITPLYSERKKDHLRNKPKKTQNTQISWIPKFQQYFNSVVEIWLWEQKEKFWHLPITGCAEGSRWSRTGKLPSRCHINTVSKGLSEEEEGLNNTLEHQNSQHIQDGSAARQVWATFAGTPTQLKETMQWETEHCSTIPLWEWE